MIQSLEKLAFFDIRANKILVPDSDQFLLSLLNSANNFLIAFLLVDDISLTFIVQTALSLFHCVQIFFLYFPQLLL